VSGKLVRTVTVQSRVVAPRPVPEASAAPAPSTLSIDASVNEIIADAAQRHGVDPLLVHSVIQVESAYNSNAISPAGAQGLMQLIPSTARQLGVKDAFSPRENIEAGVKYLKYLTDYYKNDLRLALAAYNAGPGAVDKYKWIPPYAETQNYVYQVGKRLGDAKRRASIQPSNQSGPAVPVAKPAADKIVETKPVEPVYPKIQQYVDPEGRLHLRTP
jgi:soluble lytic murein transglycosylase-like protein